MEAPFNDRGSRGIEGAQAPMPSSRRIVDRHKVPLGELGKLEIRWHEAGGKHRAPGRCDQARGSAGAGRGNRDWDDAMATNECWSSEEKGQGVGIVG
jgi:hypothetical protein